MLRGLLAADEAVMASVARLMRPGAVLSLLVSATARDRGVGVDPIRDDTLLRVADAYSSHGLTVIEARQATAADVTATHSTWAKRLGVGFGRRAWLLRATMHGNPIPPPMTDPAFAVAKWGSRAQR